MAALLPFLDNASEGSSSKIPSWQTWKPLLCSIEILDVMGTREDMDHFARKLMSGATSLEEGVEIATWVLKLTETSRRDRGTRDLIYDVVHKIMDVLFRLSPRPPPDVVLVFLVSHQGRIRLSFGLKRDPFVALLELYSQLFVQDRRRLDPIGTDPTPDQLERLEAFRVEHLVAVRAIHQAMKEVEHDVFSVRGYTSLMDAYNQGRSFEDVWGIWHAMRKEGGVGIDSRAVSVYLDACGYSGSLDRAISTWKQLQGSSFVLNLQNYHAFGECLVRCGAWDERVRFLTDQQAQHLLNPTSTPPFTAPAIAALLKLARRLARHPRHRTLRDVSWESYLRLKRQVERILPQGMLVDVDALMSKSTRLVVPGGLKTGSGRRAPREYGVQLDTSTGRGLNTRDATTLPKGSSPKFINNAALMIAPFARRAPKLQAQTTPYPNRELNTWDAAFLKSAAEWNAESDGEHKIWLRAMLHRVGLSPPS